MYPRLFQVRNRFMARQMTALVKRTQLALHSPYQRGELPPLAPLMHAILTVIPC